MVRIKLTLIEKDGDMPDDISIGDSIDIVVDEFRQIIIGREPLADVLIKAPTVGLKVVVLRLETGGVTISDLGSGAGSALDINGVRTERPSGLLLSDGAALWLGKVGFRVALSHE